MRRVGSGMIILELRKYKNMKTINTSRLQQHVQPPPTIPAPSMFTSKPVEPMRRAGRWSKSGKWSTRSRRCSAKSRANKSVRHKTEQSRKYASMTLRHAFRLDVSPSTGGSGPNTSVIEDGARKYVSSSSVRDFVHVKTVNGYFQRDLVAANKIQNTMYRVLCGWWVNQQKSW